MNAVSVEYIEAREDEIAEMLNAIEDVDEIRHTFRLMNDNNMLMPGLYKDLRERLGRIESALATGKRNTGTLRNGGIR